MKAITNLGLNASGLMARVMKKKIENEYKILLLVRLTRIEENVIDLLIKK